MKHIKTISLGCNNADQVVYTIKFDENTIQAHATIMSQFGNALWKIQNLYEEGIINNSVVVNVFIPERFVGLKLHPDNINTCDQHLIYFMENFYPPACGVVFKIYTFVATTTIQSPWSAKVIWPFSKQWIGDGDYITVQKYGETVLSKDVHYFRDIAMNSGQLDVIDNIDQYSEYPVKEISYTMRDEDFFDTLIHSRQHYTYMGASYYSAGLINCPTICYGFPTENSAWGMDMGNGFGNICQYDFNKTYNGPQTYVTHTNSVNELKAHLLDIPPPTKPTVYYT